MKEDKKPVPARAIQAQAELPTPSAMAYADALGMEMPIRVALVRWDRPIQYPGRGADTQAKTEKLANGNTWDVTYLQGMRHFRILHYDNAKRVSIVGYVHESRALSWEPL